MANRPAYEPQIEKRSEPGVGTEIGRTGLVQYAGRVYEERLPRLRTWEQERKVYREMMDNDPDVGAVLFAVDMLMRQVEWTVDPAVEPEPKKTPEPPMSQFEQQAALAEQQAGHAIEIERTRAANKPKPTAPVKKAKEESMGANAPTPEQAQEVADFVQSCLEDMSFSWEDLLSQVLTMVGYGFSYHEVVYKKRSGPDGNPTSKFNDGKIGWRKIAPRSQDSLLRWEFDEESDDLKGFWQLVEGAGGEPVFIPIEKALLFRTQMHKNNPQGRSCLRNAYRPWYFKKRIEEIEGIGLERDLAGLPIVWVPPQWLSADASDEEKAALAEMKTIVRAVKRDENEGIVMPLDYFPETQNKKYDITLLSTAGERQFDTDKIVQRYRQEIVMTILADFILLGHEKIGTHALSVSKVDLFQMALGAWLDAIADVFNSHAIPRLLKINGIPMEHAPKLAHSKLETVDLKALGEFLDKISGAGMPLFPDESLEGHLRRVAGLPEAPQEEAL